MYEDKYMALAIKEALKAYQEDEVPIGCVIVKEGKVLAKAHNNKVKKNDATAHSEIECIKKASKKLKNWHLDDCDMYVTLEPCLMCTGGIINSRIKNVYFAARDPKGGALESNLKINEVKGLNHYPNFEFVENMEYIYVLKQFFKEKRKKGTLI
ncbi:MAG: nucleoside deaminase [Erysipelotrichaceae bacterium]|nr:nucleoside deaminase [Erysipelotrichaceae bacterium]